MLADAGDHKVVAVFDPDERRSRELAEQCGAEVCSSVEEVLDRVDLVYVCTWTSEHRPLVELAADHGVAVFCEKPLATNLADASAMVDVVDQTGVVNQVGLVLRSLPSFRRLRDLLADPGNGRAMTFVFRDDQFLPVGGHYDSSWRADPTKAGAGALLEHSIHDLDIVEWLLGPVVGVRAHTDEFHGIAGIEDLAVVMVDLASGATGTLTSVWHDVTERPSLRRLEVFCERAWYALEGDFGGPVAWQRENGDDGSIDGDQLWQPAERPELGWSNPARVLLDGVRDGTPVAPSFRDALRAHELAAAVYRSAASGERVSTAPATGPDGGRRSPPAPPG